MSCRPDVPCLLIFVFAVYFVTDGGGTRGAAEGAAVLRPGAPAGHLLVPAGARGPAQRRRCLQRVSDLLPWSVCATRPRKEQMPTFSPAATLRCSQLFEVAPCNGHTVPRTKGTTP